MQATSQYIECNRSPFTNTDVLQTDSTFSNGRQNRVQTDTEQTKTEQSDSKRKLCEHIMPKGLCRAAIQRLPAGDTKLKHM